MMRPFLYAACAWLFLSCVSEGPLPQPEPDPTPDPKPTAKQIDWNGFADDFQLSLTTLYAGDHGTYKTHPVQGGFNYWFNAHVLDVLVDGYKRTGDDAYLDRMKAFLRGVEIVNPGYWKVYVDDMAWLGIASMNAWDATQDDEYKEVATYILSEIRKAHTSVLGGGLQWRFDQPNGKNACSTAPGGILAARLYQADGKEDDLILAEELFAWLTETLLNPSNNLVWDNIHLNEQGNPTVQTWMFTYNVGTYVGLARDLFVVTGDEKYLQAASRSAVASVSSSDMVANGMFKETGDHDGGLFKGILVRYLTELAYTEGISANLKNQLVEFLSRNATILYEKGSSPAPTRFAASDWSMRPERPTDLSTQLSAMMLAEAVAQFHKSGWLSTDET